MLLERREEKKEEGRRRKKEWSLRFRKQLPIVASVSRFFSNPAYACPGSLLGKTGKKAK